MPAATSARNETLRLSAQRWRNRPIEEAQEHHGTGSSGKEGRSLRLDSSSVSLLLFRRLVMKVVDCKTRTVQPRKHWVALSAEAMGQGSGEVGRICCGDD